jgi:KUP system potassium uptake protein
MVNWLLAAGTLGAVLLFGSSDALGGAYGSPCRCSWRSQQCSRACRTEMGLPPDPDLHAQRSVLDRRPDLRVGKRDEADRWGIVPTDIGGDRSLSDADLANRLYVARTPALAIAPGQGRVYSLGARNSSRPAPWSGRDLHRGSSGIPLALTHHLRHNRVLHGRVLLVSMITSGAPRVAPEERVGLIPIGMGITRVLLHFGFMEHPNVMDGLKLACRDPALSDIDPEHITFYTRRIMVVPSGKVPGMAVWREQLFAAMHLNATSPRRISGSPRPRSPKSVSKSRSDHGQEPCCRRTVGLRFRTSRRQRSMDSAAAEM